MFLGIFVEIFFFEIKILLKWGTWKILLPYKILTLDFFLFYEITGITKNVDCFHSYIFNVNTKKMNRFI